LSAYDGVVARIVALAACALCLVAPGCGGDDDDEADTPAPPPERTAGQALWPPPDSATDDPVRAARSFVEEYIGVEDPALGPFAEKGAGAGEVDVHRRGEDGRQLAAVVSTLSLRQVEGDWLVESARSAEVEVATPAAGAEIASPTRIAGRGRGFEGNVVLEVREQYAVEPLAQKPVTAGSLEQLEPFSARLAFDFGGAEAGAIVAKTGSGIAAADGFAAFPVRFRPG
jgi:hypothetical protein